MITVQEIQAAVPKLSHAELVALKEWLDEYYEDQLELTEDVKAKLDQSKADIEAGRVIQQLPGVGFHSSLCHGRASC